MTRLTVFLAVVIAVICSVRYTDEQDTSTINISNYSQIVNFFSKCNSYLIKLKFFIKTKNLPKSDISPGRLIEVVQ